MKNRYIWPSLLRLNPSTEEFPWDDLRKIFRECQWMAKVPKGEKNCRIFQTAEWGVRTLQTTGGLAIAYKNRVAQKKRSRQKSVMLNTSAGGVRKPSPKNALYSAKYRQPILPSNGLSSTHETSLTRPTCPIRGKSFSIRTSLLCAGVPLP